MTTTKFMDKCFEAWDEAVWLPDVRLRYGEKAQTMISEVDRRNRDLDIDVEHLCSFVNTAVKLISNRQCTIVEGTISENVTVKATRLEDIIHVDIKGLT